jgi:phosphate uptake regulator
MFKKKVSKFISDTLDALKAEDRKFDEEFRKASEQIDSFRKEMEEWRAQRKINRSK